MKTEMSAVRGRPLHFECKLRGHVFRRPFEAVLLERAPINATHQVILERARARIASCMFAYITNESSALQRESAVAYVLAVLVPPGTTDKIVPQKIIRPFLGIHDPRIPLNEQRMTGADVLRHLVPDELTPS